MSNPLVVLLAEDTDHDVRAMRRCWDEIGTQHVLRVVRDGAECLDYLLRRGEYESPESSPRPGLLLLDINMPRVDGMEVLRRIKATPGLKRLPVVILTSGDIGVHIEESYDLGASAFFTKPLGRANLLAFLETLIRFWEAAYLPDVPVAEKSLQPERFQSP